MNAIKKVSNFAVRSLGKQTVDVYDLEVNRTHNFFGNNILLHNSCYITLEKFVDKYIPNGTTDQKITFVDKFCKTVVQPEINRLIKIIRTRYLNGVGDYLSMNREIIGDKAIWTAKKRYIVNVLDEEGIRHNPSKLKVMGLEIKKATVPKFCREAMKEAVKIIMDKNQDTLYEFIAETKSKFLQQPIANISFPRGCNGVVKYGNEETIYGKKTPFHVKGALLYNHLLKQLNLTTKYPKIKEGEKIKFFYLIEPNPWGINSMAFLSVVPPEFNIDKYIDYEMQWEKTFIEPLKLILNAIGWKTEPTANLDSFFEW